MPSGFVWLAVPIAAVVLAVLMSSGESRILHWFAQRVARRQVARLSRMTADEMAQEARWRIHRTSWKGFPSATALVDRGAGWSDRDLHDTLAALGASIVEEDRRLGLQGRDSNHFEFHDLGLAVMLEVLEARLKSEPTSASE